MSKSYRVAVCIHLSAISLWECSECFDLGLNVAIFIFMRVKCVNQMFNEVQTGAVDTITIVTPQCFGKNLNAVLYFQQRGLSL